MVLRSTASNPIFNHWMVVSSSSKKRLERGRESICFGEEFAGIGEEGGSDRIYKRPSGVGL